MAEKTQGKDKPVTHTVPGPKANAAFGTSTKNMFQRFMTALRHGLSFGDARDYYAVFGYPRVLTCDDLYAKYERQDITSRIVDMPPEETWAYPPKIKADTPRLADDWGTFVDTSKPWPALTQCDRLLAFGQYSILWLGVPGSLQSPATKVSGPDQISYLRAYGGSNVGIAEWEANPNNPRYGLPNLYDLTTEESNLKVRVHYTRVIHMVDKPLQGSTSSIPRLAFVYNLLDDFLKIGGGSAETFWLIANRGLQIDVDKEMDLTTEDAQKLADEVEEFQHQLRRVMRTRGVTVTPLGSDNPDPSGIFKVLVSLLASATGIPQRILMGAEAGQLASEQDRANWAEFMERRRKSFAEPYVLLPLITRLGELGALPLLKGKIEFAWPSAFHQSPLEKAQTSAQFARSVVNASRQTQFGQPVATVPELRRALDLPSEPENGEQLPEAYTPPANPNTVPADDPANAPPQRQAQP